jgi:hypothetical protein
MQLSMNERKTEHHLFKQAGRPAFLR